MSCYTKRIISSFLSTFSIYNNYGVYRYFTISYLKNKITQQSYKKLETYQCEINSFKHNYLAKSLKGIKFIYRINIEGFFKQFFHLPSTQVKVNRDIIGKDKRYRTFISLLNLSGLQLLFFNTHTYNNAHFCQLGTRDTAVRTSFHQLLYKQLLKNYTIQYNYRFPSRTILIM